MAFPPLRLACSPRRCGCPRFWNTWPRPARTICCRIFAWGTLCLISTPHCQLCSARRPWRPRLCSRSSIGGVRPAPSARRLRCLSCCCFPSLWSRFTKCGTWAAIRRSPCAMASSRCFSASRSMRLFSPGRKSCRKAGLRARRSLFSWHCLPWRCHLLPPPCCCISGLRIFPPTPARFGVLRSRFLCSSCSFSPRFWLGQSWDCFSRRGCCRAAPSPCCSVSCSAWKCLSR